MDTELDKCPICLNNIIQEDVKIYSYDEDTFQKYEVVKLKCNHMICKHCLDQWLAKSLYCTCPICNTSLYQENIIISIDAPLEQENYTICTQKCVKIVSVTLFVIFVIIIICKLFLTN